MEILVTKTIPRNKLTEYKDYIGYLFKTEDGVLNICNTVEDIMKSNQWFNNFPLKTIVVNKDKIEIGDKILAICTNQNLNGKIFKYLGPSDGEGLIELEGLDGKYISTHFLLDTSFKFVRKATLEDKEKVINRKITEYEI